MGGNFRIATRLIEHQRYLADRPRLEAYERALRQVVRPDDVVLDLGCGTGILGLLALRAGARKVYAVDDGPVLQLARQIARDNGYGEQVQHIRGHSTGVELPEQADLVVADQMAPFALGAGLLRCMRDDADRLLKPAARSVPAAIELLLAPAADVEAHRRVSGFAAPIAGLDVSAGLSIMENMGQNKAVSAAQLFAAPQPAMRLALPLGPTGAQRAELRFAASQAGVVHGLMGCFRAELGADVSISNDPSDPDRIDRDQLILPCEPLTVTPRDGLRVELQIQHDAQLVSWRMWRDGERKPRLRSTFAGMLIDRDAVRGAGAP